MEERRLPQPATNADEYLYDIAKSLRHIVGVLAALPAMTAAALAEPAPAADESADGDTVELKEPKTKRKHRG